VLPPWLSGHCFCAMQRLTSDALPQELLPALLTAVGQHVRPVAPHLFTPAERAVMERMTEMLLNHAATLALTGPDAMPVEGVPDIPLLSPPVHRLVIFPVSLHGA
jgi:hypothetical protein